MYVWRDIGDVYRAQKKYDAAIKAYEAGLTLEPEYANWHNNLGVGYRYAKRCEEALVSSRKALEIRPDFPSAWVNIGNVYKDQKKYREIKMRHYPYTIEV